MVCASVCWWIVNGGELGLGRDLAMHIAASSPVCVTEDQVPADMLAKEREITEVQAKESGKPDNIIEKMIEGRMRKYLGEITLVGSAVRQRSRYNRRQAD
jgi:elongation factor Ts